VIEEQRLFDAAHHIFLQVGRLDQPGDSEAKKRHNKISSLPVVDRGKLRQTARQHFCSESSDHLSVISSIKTVRLINAIQNFDCGGGSGHEPDCSVGRSLLSETVCGDVLARSMER